MSTAHFYHHHPEPSNAPPLDSTSSTTAIMTRLPSESFWPTGALETSDSSIISPLTLPRGASGCFDQVSTKPNPSTCKYHPPAKRQQETFEAATFTHLYSPGRKRPCLASAAAIFVAIPGSCWTSRSNIDRTSLPSELIVTPAWDSTDPEPIRARRQER